MASLFLSCSDKGADLGWVTTSVEFPNVGKRLRTLTAVGVGRINNAIS